MKLRIDRIISIATLLASLVAITLVLRRPAPVTAPQAPAAAIVPAPSTNLGAAVRVQSQQSSSSPSGSAALAPAATVAAAQPATGPTQSNAKPDAGIDSDRISSAVAQMLGGAGGAANLSPDSNVGNGDPVIKDQQVTMDGDVVHGKFLTQIAGKDVWVTISGHMGEKDGYATFDPTEFKVGDTEIPVSLVNPVLQRKLAEERDRLKIPSNSQ